MYILYISKLFILYLLFQVSLIILFSLQCWCPPRHCWRGSLATHPLRLRQRPPKVRKGHCQLSQPARSEWTPPSPRRCQGQQPWAHRKAAGGSHAKVHMHMHMYTHHMYMYTYLVYNFNYMYMHMYTSHGHMHNVHMSRYYRYIYNSAVHIILVLYCGTATLCDVIMIMQTSEGADQPSPVWSGPLRKQRPTLQNTGERRWCQPNCKGNPHVY
jgi:hypothetical protein